MPTKEEFLVKFASQTGAEIPGIGSQQKGSVDINTNTPDLTATPTPTEVTTLTEANTPTESPTPTENTLLQEEEELFKDSFSDRTKIPLWEDPKFKGIIVALCVLPAVMTVGWVFKDGIPKPNLSTKSSRPAPVKQEADVDKPKDATDGEWASYASTNGMRQQFANAAEDEDPDAQKKFQERVNARRKSQVSSATVKPNTRPERTSERTDSVPPYRTYRTASRSYTPAAPVVTARTNIPEDYTPGSHRISRSYTPPIPKPISYRVPPALSKPPAVSPKNSQSLDSSQQQNSPQERIAAIIAATSTALDSSPATVAATSTEDNSEPATVASAYPRVSNEPAIVASAAIPSRSKAIVPHATKSVRSPDPVAHLSSEAAVIEGQSQTLINRSLSARGILLTSIAFTSGDYATIANQPVEIELKEALGDIPAGARIVAVVQANQSNNYSGNGKSEVVRLNPIAIAIGDMEMPLPEGVIALSGKDNAPLIAKTGGSSFLRFVGGLAGTVAGGAGLTNFGASQNVEIGDSSYFKSIGANIATNVVSNAARELQRSGSGNGILVLKAGSTITISVHKPLVLPDL
ncbi:hypothetical protein [Synechocystis sp. PCC 7509]|uniref:hypothetical protein n=1 Tax=Synechocystis sp. PCC 7509 TaxID=927677 RepID=UPI0002ABA816|nr:hypothetical protein [Synechocystis sp. PCC 7509]